MNDHDSVLEKFLSNQEVIVRQLDNKELVEYNLYFKQMLHDAFLSG